MPHLPQEIIIKLIASILLGGAIGLERELRSKSAGFRTMILICLGATMYTLFSQYLGHRTSPDRIASNIVVGIGFLGAGVIFRSNSSVTGITTAATIWLTAAVGVAIGIGWYSVAVAACLMILVVLVLFSFMDKAIDRVNQLREYKIAYPYEEHKQHKYEQLFKHYKLSIKTGSQSKVGNIITGTWLVAGNEKKHHAFIEQILKDATVTAFNF
ncbi:magnesium transporter MgtC [Flavipsychrobacter stenotrophus]|uniref:Magnesium transporter MgtC n=1 Tax=Flavipsychrobacter stenotrophus TaxID=2077091 RepID=A0A2S7SW29_9BACT|nr:MgtC/SapB family protein [Flavipsychrobacter stenotrophus]PQJ10918.1 magnesium transporter MgtC [Flavipsychrobacter stenotrophus]